MKYGCTIQITAIKEFGPTFFQPCFFALRLTTSSIPAEESIARTGTSGKDFLTSAVTVPRPHPSSRTVEEELGGAVWVA